MTLQGTLGALGASPPHFLHPNSHPALAPFPPGLSAGPGAGRGEAEVVCKRASSASLRDVLAGPGVVGRCARPRPSPRAPVPPPPPPPAPLSAQPAAPKPRPGRGLVGSAGPSHPPHTHTGLHPPGKREKDGLRPQSCGVGEAAAATGRPVRPASRLPPGPPERRRRASGDRAALTSASGQHRFSMASGVVPEPRVSSGGHRRGPGSRCEASHS